MDTTRLDSLEILQFLLVKSYNDTLFVPICLVMNPKTLAIIETSNSIKYLLHNTRNIGPHLESLAHPVKGAQMEILLNRSSVTGIVIASMIKTAEIENLREDLYRVIDIRNEYTLVYR
jgi:hypothetical protein